jgi:hypothetical protein
MLAQELLKTKQVSKWSHSVIILAEFYLSHFERLWIPYAKIPQSLTFVNGQGILQLRIPHAEISQARTYGRKKLF